MHRARSLCFSPFWLLPTLGHAQIGSVTAAPVTANRPIGGITGTRGQLPWVLTTMAPILAPCVQPTTTPRVFTRCYDTHSSIHAHWAAYRLARSSSGFTALALTSQLALDPVKLNTEVAYMQYPYAAAWFLRLAVDYEQWATMAGAPDRLRLRTVGDRMAGWLQTYYSTWPINPYSVEYDNPAWALYQLHAYATFTGNSVLATQVQATIATAFVRPITNRTLLSDLNVAEFFSVVGNWYYVIAKTQPPATVQSFLAMQPAIPQSHLAVSGTSGVHAYGMIWSRAWAFRVMAQVALSSSDRLRFAQAAYDHVQTGMARHPQLTGNFANYDHWVPQFAVYAITEGL
ncbi:MAG: DUF2891 family protein [Planctomycetes bacterium]|nr:DUF2891 family protein [Planctomycetota bacterium]